MQYTKIPSIIDNLIERIAAKARVGNFLEISDKLLAIKPITWFNLPYQLNKLVGVIKEFQLILDNEDLQNSINSLGTIIWFNILKKVAELIKTVELIESL